ncbi:unnamed protein product [Eretmochelys imbricata]
MGPTVFTHLLTAGKARARRRGRAPLKPLGPLWQRPPPLLRPCHRPRRPSPLPPPPALRVPLPQPPGCMPGQRQPPCLPPCHLSRPPPLPPSIVARAPFPTMTRKHGVRCLLVLASPHVETYVWALAVGPSAIVAASKMYGKVIFFLASEAAAQEAVERGLAVRGGVFVPLELLEDLGIHLVLTSVPPFLPSAALLPTLSTLGKPVSVISPLPLGCKDSTLCHIFSFCWQVQLLLPSAARDGEALEGSFLVHHQRARYRVYFSMGKAWCYL